MKKLLSRTCILSLMIGLCHAFTPMTIEAKEDYNIYPMACSAYEVDLFEQNGTFTQKGCYNDIESAKNAMFSLNDSNAVVRHAQAYSVNKVIMMMSGVVYSYPQRNGSNTANIYQFYENIANRKTTYVTAHREMSYNGTYTYDGNGDGWVAVTLNGFDGFISLKNVDLIPMRAVTDRIPMTLGGNCTYGSEEPFRVQIHQAYYRVEQNGNYLDLVYHCFSGWPSNGTEPVAWHFAIGPAASWMKQGAVYYSKNGTDFYTDRTFTNSAGSYYSYYQFLPLRTKTNISSAVFEDFLNTRNIPADSKLRGTGQLFIDAQNEYGINALSVFAMACLESAYGTSHYAMQRNNLFGWQAYDSDPDQAGYFGSIDQAIREHMAINLRGFVDINDYRFFGAQLGNKGSGLNVKYASDPYWGMKIASIAYQIDKQSRGNDGTLTDYDRAALGIITDDQPTNVLSTISGSVLYNTAYGATYQKNHVVTLLSASSDWIEIQSTNILVNKNVLPLRNQGLISYDWQNNIGWLKASQITRINSTELTHVGDQPAGDPVQLFQSAEWGSETLYLSGSQYQPGIYADENNPAAHTITVYDTSLQEVAKIEAEGTVEDNDRLLWSAEIPLSTLENGIYTFAIDTAYQTTTQYNLHMNLNVPETLPSDYMTSGKTYHLSALSNDLALEVTDSDCGAGAVYDADQNACVCISGFEETEQGCTVIEIEEADSKMMQMLGSLSYDAEKKETLIEGVAFLPGYDASKDADIQHKVILVNLETGEETPLETISLVPTNGLSLGDGFTYDLIGYQAILKDDDIKEGSYYFMVCVRNGKVSQDRFIITTDASVDQKDRLVDEMTVRIYAEAMSNFRLEMFVGKSMIDRTVIQKPTRRPSVYGETSLQLDEQGVLTIDGYGFLTNTYIDADNHPVYQLLFENTSTGEVTAEPVTTKACAVDLASLRGTKYTISQACFEVSKSLESLADGTYRIYLDIKTDQARDIFAIYQYAKNELPTVTVGDRIYLLTKTNGHSQYELEITKDPTKKEAE